MTSNDPTSAVTDRRLSRRTFVSIGAGAFVVAALPGLPGLPRLALGRERLVRRSVPVMGTIADLMVVDMEEARAHAAIDAAIRELQLVDATMSHFSATSDVGRANLAAENDAVVITDATAVVLRESIRWADASNGRFDPCLGRATALWTTEGRRRPPADEEVKRLTGDGAYRDLELDLDRGRHTVRFRSEGLAIDLGGIAKGYGVDRAATALRRAGVRNALVNAGGDLYALGRSDDGPWKVGVRDPFDPSRLAATLEMSDQGVATSGDYFRYFDHGGRRYHHLLDPTTGEPRRSRQHSVTVAAASCMAADAAATTVYGLEDPAARMLLERGDRDARIVHTA